MCVKRHFQLPFGHQYLLAYKTKKKVSRIETCYGERPCHCYTNQLVHGDPRDLTAELDKKNIFSR